VATREQVERGKRIQEARESAGLSQEALAEAVGAYEKTVSKWENGRQNPNRAKRRLIAKVLGRSESWIEHGAEVEISGGPTGLDLLQRDAEDRVLVESLEKSAELLRQRLAWTAERRDYTGGPGAHRVDSRPAGNSRSKPRGAPKPAKRRRGAKE
jgi:transcriptional regulator with XRE-family HTH domain